MDTTHVTPSFGPPRAHKARGSPGRAGTWDKGSRSNSGRASQADKGKRKQGSNPTQNMSKIDPSFKSKRYRDKLRTEIKSLESLLPVDRTAVHRKLDSQTVFRLSIGFFRTKLFMQAAGILTPTASRLLQQHPQQLDANRAPPVDHTRNDASRELSAGSDDVSGNCVEWENSESLLQALDGYMLAVTSDGTILYISENILQHLGFNQVDLVMRCIYGIVHPDDHQELKVILEQTLNMQFPDNRGQTRLCCTRATGLNGGSGAVCRTVSFLCRMKCFNGTTTGYLKMTCTGHMMSFPYVTKSSRTSNQVLFAFCRPFLSMSTDPAVSNRNHGFWTKHDLDLKFRQMEEKVTEILGYEVSDLEGTSLYGMLHPEDLLVIRNCHKALIQSEEIQTMYFRILNKAGSWLWLHTRGKIVFKNSKKYSIIFTHCPVKEEDSTYIQQEAILRQRYSLSELMYGVEQRGPHSSLPDNNRHGSHAKDDGSGLCLHDSHGQCPSSWHTAADRHSPVFPQHYQPHVAAKRPCPEPYGPAPDSTAVFTPPDAFYAGQSNNAWYNPTYQDDQSYWNPGGCFQQPNMRKEYFMHFNGVGFAAHDSAPYHQYPSASTLFIHGHVTAFESQTPPDPYQNQYNGGQYKHVYSGGYATSEHPLPAHDHTDRDSRHRADRSVKQEMACPQQGPDRTLPLYSEIVAASDFPSVNISDQGESRNHYYGFSGY